MLMHKKKDGEGRYNFFFSPYQTNLILFFMLQIEYFSKLYLDIYIFNYDYYYYFLTCSHKMGKEIQISDLRFIKRVFNRLNYFLKTYLIIN